MTLGRVAFATHQQLLGLSSTVAPAAFRSLAAAAAGTRVAAAAAAAASANGGGLQLSSSGSSNSSRRLTTSTSTGSASAMTQITDVGIFSDPGPKAGNEDRVVVGNLGSSQLIGVFGVFVS